MKDGRFHGDRFHGGRGTAARGGGKVFRKKKNTTAKTRTSNTTEHDTTEHYEADFGSAEVEVTERPGEATRVNVKLRLNPESYQGLDFESKRKTLGLHHPETLHALHVYAVTLGELPDRLDDAIELLDWLVAARADDQENRLLALNDLTRLLQDSGNPAPAEPRLREALSGWERLRGPDDAQTLQIASNLARTLLDLGRHEEAEGLMRDTAARRVRAFGATHPDTLKSRNVLAGALRGTPERLAEAERMYQQILADAADAAGELSLNVRHNLAAVLIHQGRHAEALTMYRELVAERSRRQGPDHPDTWRSRHNHAVVLNSLGRTAEAEAQIAQVLDGYRRVHGPRHVATLGVQTDLAAMKANQGRTAEALPLLRDAIEGYRRTLGPVHPRVRELMGVLAQFGG
ncbi:tetratricopeptide repeat protein [Streptomyces axinellae]|uniref:Tetratricopeptide repeat protein n=1 Tax=Streptomyces axinellae TaxID=552788 RepID=A0ABN3PR30_9ACTN